jgi:hypothetical protein
VRTAGSIDTSLHISDDHPNDMANHAANLHAAVEVPVQAGARHGVVILQSRLERPHLPVSCSRRLSGIASHVQLSWPGMRPQRVR